MRWRFWKRKKAEVKTTLQISAGNAGIQTLYVETIGPDKALELIQKLKDLAKKEVEA
jgi:hypothetical protein